MKKVLSLVLSLCLTLTLCFAAVGEAEEPITINLWHRWSSSTEQALLNVIAGFEATHSLTFIPQVSNNPREISFHPSL